MDGVDRTRLDLAAADCQAVRHEELLLAIIVAGMRSYEEYPFEDAEATVKAARADLAEIHRQLEGEG